MGTLRQWNLAPIMEAFGCRYLFETGTSSGDGVHYACFFRFDEIWSVEIIDALAQQARQRFAGDNRVHILNEASETALVRILPAVPPSRPILFWLDAHFPGADNGLAGYGDEPDVDRRLPLQRELDVIAALRPTSRDVVIIDDLRIYEDGDWEQGPLPECASTLPPERRNIDFIERSRWAVTHNIERSTRHTGYLMLTPKPRAAMAHAA